MVGTVDWVGFGHEAMGHLQTLTGTAKNRIWREQSHVALASCLGVDWTMGGRQERARRLDMFAKRRT